MSMAELRLLEWATAPVQERRRVLTGGSDHDGFDAGLRSSIASIVDDVRSRGGRCAPRFELQARSYR